VPVQTLPKSSKYPVNSTDAGQRYFRRHSGKMQQLHASPAQLAESRSPISFEMLFTKGSSWNIAMVLSLSRVVN
jgi:hypothetical protein